jgi:hypothetical protein
MLGKKKLAYPIKKTRNGFYILKLSISKVQKLDRWKTKSAPRSHHPFYGRQPRRTRTPRGQRPGSPGKNESFPQTTARTTPQPAEAPINLSETELEQKIEKLWNPKTWQNNKLKGCNRFRELYYNN